MLKPVSVDLLHVALVGVEGERLLVQQPGGRELRRAGLEQAAAVRETHPAVQNSQPGGNYCVVTEPGGLGADPQSQILRTISGATNLEKG